MNPSTETTQPVETTVSRVLNAPRTLVWEMWTNPKHAMQWWGPDGFTTTLYELDLRAGGAFRVQLRGRDGTIVEIVATVEDVVPPERLVTFGIVESDGTLAYEARRTVTFEERGSQTVVTVRHQFSKSSPDTIGGARQGWDQLFARLEAYMLAREA